MSAVHVLCAALAFAVLFLILRSRLRRKRRDEGFFRALSPWEDGMEIKVSVKRQFMFWGGVMAGISSAALTHQLDVMKTCRQLGTPLPDTVGGSFVGVTMGSVAQGARFGVTLVLNVRLQRRLTSLEESFAKGSCSQIAAVFCFSILASGISEVLTNPFSVVKNYQIANNLDVLTACRGLYSFGGLRIFFLNGVGCGVLRKSVANGIMLQTIGRVKSLLKRASPRWLGEESGRPALGFVSGSLASAFAEAVTNHPDMVRTLEQTGVPLLDAVVLASKEPFRGALWAAVRKGAIRGINWGCLEIIMTMMEGTYRKYRKVASPPALHARRGVRRDLRIGEDRNTLSGSFSQLFRGNSMPRISPSHSGIFRKKV